MLKILPHGLLDPGHCVLMAQHRPDGGGVKGIVLRVGCGGRHYHLSRASSNGVVGAATVPGSQLVEQFVWHVEKYTQRSKGAREAILV